MKDNAEGTRAEPWPVRPLGELFEVVGGGTPSKGTATYYGGDIPWATIRDMHSAELCETEHTITALGLTHSSAKLIPAGEVIMASRVGLGKACILKQDTAINQDIRALIPRQPTEIDRHFCLYWLQSVSDQIVDAGTGATVQGIKLPFIKSLPFPAIQLEEQKRIVAILDRAFTALDRARAHAEANLADAEELFPSVLSRAFEPDEPWELCCVADLVARGILERPIDGNHGETHPKKADFVESGVPFIMASDLMDGVVDQSGCYFLNRKQADALRKGFAKDGDVLLSHKGTIGRAAVLDTDLDYVMLTPQVTYYRVANSDFLDRDFLYFCMRSSAFQKQMIEIARAGATRAYIGITRQQDLAIPLPKVDVQRKLVQRFREVEAKSRELVDDYSARISNIADLRQSLLHEAFAGRLT